MTSDWSEVARGTRFHCDLLAAVLEARGMPTLVTGQDTYGAGMSLDVSHLYVPAGEAEEARRILEADV